MSRSGSLGGGVVTLDAVDDLQALGGLDHALKRLLSLQAGLDLGDHVVEADEDTLLLGVAITETHLLDLDVALGDLVVAEEDGKRNTIGLGSLELLWYLGLDLVQELGLKRGTDMLVNCRDPGCRLLVAGVVGMYVP